MNSIKNFLKTVYDVIIETKRLQAESYVRRYSNF
jgi:hypothetical protein